MNRLAAMNRAAHVAASMGPYDLRKLGIDVESATLGLQLASLLDKRQLQQAVDYAYRLGDEVNVVPFHPENGEPWRSSRPEYPGA